MAHIVTVGELGRYLAGLIAGDNALRNLGVRGEISNFKQYGSGHCYFNLKDKDGIIPCVMFRANALRLRFCPQDGMQVVASGSVNVYTAGGKYQLYVDAMVPDGVGDLAMAFEQLKRKLAAEGMFDELHKQPLPMYPRKIGIVTSPTGAVLRDIYRVAKRRFPAIQLVLKPVQVQGRGAAEQIGAAIDFFNEKYSVDVLIVGRGGGSMEDLWAFNEEVTVRAIYNSKIPVISAVGHETDFTLADFAADRRAATPSQAAEFAVRDAGEIRGQIAGLKKRLYALAKYQLDSRENHLANIMTRPVMLEPSIMLSQRHQKMDLLLERLNRSVQSHKEQKKQCLIHLMDKLELVNPMGVLRRGYGMLKNDQEKVISSVSQITPGDRLAVVLQDGKVLAKAESIEEV